MSREFSLVLLGSGVLATGYFAAPSPAEELEQKAEAQAAARVGHTSHSTTHRTHGFVPLLFLHSPGYATGRATSRPASMPGVSRGGFGGTSHAVSGGGS